MPAIVRIHEFLKEKEQAIKGFIRQKKDPKHPEDLHRLRLEIKKSRAAMGILSKVSQKIKAAGKQSPFRALFKQAGKIRELQLHKAYLDKHKVLPELPVYHKVLKEETGAEMQRLLDLKKSKDLRVFAKSPSLMNGSTLKGGEQRLQQLLHADEVEILGLLHKEKLKVSEAHELRKRIKSYYFLTRIVKPKTSSLKDLDKFQELLGTWHDYEVFSAELKKAGKLKSLPKSEKKSIRRLQPKMVRKRDDLFRKIDRTRFRVVAN